MDELILAALEAGRRNILMRAAQFRAKGEADLVEILNDDADDIDNLKVAYVRARERGETDAVVRLFDSIQEFDTATREALLDRIELHLATAQNGRAVRLRLIWLTTPKPLL